MKEKTISGRMKPETILEIQFLKKKLGLNQTAIIETAIHRLYEEAKIKKAKPTRYEIFTKIGLGGIEGPTNLSENYKEEFYNYLKEKHGKN